MANEPQLTKQTMSILNTLACTESVSGSALAGETGLASGTLYPILVRLEDAKWITSQWDETNERPRRRLYRITALGMKRARQEAIEWKPFVERFA